MSLVSLATHMMRDTHEWLAKHEWLATSCMFHEVSALSSCAIHRAICLTLVYNANCGGKKLICVLGCRPSMILARMIASGVCLMIPPGVCLAVSCVLSAAWGQAKCTQSCISCGQAKCTQSFIYIT